jgi:hypothetical protein
MAVAGRALFRQVLFERPLVMVRASAARPRFRQTIFKRDRRTASWASSRPGALLGQPREFHAAAFAWAKIPGAGHISSVAMLVTEPRTATPVCSLLPKRRASTLQHAASSAACRFSHTRKKPHCLAGHIGLEPANPSASYLIGIAWQLHLRAAQQGGGDCSHSSSMIRI